MQIGQRKTGYSLCCNPFNVLAEWTGLEPATPGVTGRYSNQLNYHSNNRNTRFNAHIAVQTI